MLSVGAIHFKIGFVLAERVGQGKVGRCTTLPDSAWRPLQLPIEKLWPMLGGPFVCLLAQTGIENAPFTLYRLHLWHFKAAFSPEERFLLGEP